MDLLWEAHGPLTIRQVLEAMPEERTPAYTTVQTVMDRLHRKGILVRESSGRANIYRPVSTRADHAAATMQDALHGAGDAQATLLHFVKRMDNEQARALRSALARLSATRSL